MAVEGEYDEEQLPGEVVDKLEADLCTSERQHFAVRCKFASCLILSCGLRAECVELLLRRLVCSNARKIQTTLFDNKDHPHRATVALQALPVYACSSEAPLQSHIACP